MSDMIECVARAMCAADGGSLEVDVHHYRDMARAAIEAMREYSNEMYVAAASVSSASDQDIINIWQAMIDAALAETAVTQEK
jgi:hypothetical protein